MRLGLREGRLCRPITWGRAGTLGVRGGTRARWVPPNPAEWRTRILNSLSRAEIPKFPHTCSPAPQLWRMVTGGAVSSGCLEVDDAPPLASLMRITFSMLTVPTRLRG